MKMAEKFISFIKSKQHSLVNLLIHLSAVSLFVLPEVITNIDDQRPVPNGIIIKTIIYLVIFYINYFLIDRFLDKKGGKWHFVGMNIVLLVVASGIILTTSHGYTDKDFHPIKNHLIMKKHYLLLNTKHPMITHLSMYIRLVMSIRIFISMPQVDYRATY